MFIIFVVNKCLIKMSPRIKRNRKVLNLPLIKGFKPYGPESGSDKKEPVILLYEEYEALRLCDYDMCNHLEASAIMNISRPTYTRIYAAVRQKIAKAFVEGRQIVIEGGKVYFDSDWYHCESCGCYANNPDKEKSLGNCPLCGSLNIHEYDYDNENNLTDAEESCDNVCICPECGYEQEHLRARPCNSDICPECNTPMVRKNNNK